MTDPATNNNKHVVIIGCGFGGLAAAKTFAHRNVTVTLLDRNNHHLFQPLLYQVATAGLSAPSIASPARYILRKAKNVTVLMSEVTSIDVARSVVVTDHGELRYDALIVAAGADTHYFGHDQWEQVAPGLKTLEDALLIRRRILEAFEQAELCEDDEQRRALLTFVVVGGGPTGVELVGTLAEIARHTLADEFRRFRPGDARIMLIEGGPDVLPALSQRSRKRARTQLERLGVSVLTGMRVEDIRADGLTAIDPDGQAIAVRARTVLWAAGVRASTLSRSLTSQPASGGRVGVNLDLTLPGHANVYVIGDLASVQGHEPPVPGVAPAAKQMGRHAAENILRALAGRPLLPFRYRDWGALATIGRNAGVADIGRVRLSGYPAWAFWLCVHIFFLIGFRNRISVMFDWALSYMTFERAARIIMRQR